MAERYMLPLAFGLAPAIMLLAAWPNSPAPVIQATKVYAVPILAVEITVICAAFLNGLKLKLSRSAATALFGLVLVAWGTAALAPLQSRSLLWTGFWMIHLLFGFAVARLFEPRPAILGLMYGFLAFVLLLALRIASGPVADWESNPPGFDQVRRFGYYSAAMAGFGAGALAVWPRRLFPFLVLVAAFGLMFWTGARGAAAGFLLATAVAAMAFPAFRQWRLAGLIAAASVPGILLVILCPPPAGFMGLGRMVSAHAEMGIATGRMEVWRAVIEAIGQRPWLGWGEAQTELFVPFGQPHNLLLQILLAWGIIGAGLLLYLAFLLVRDAIPRIRSDDGLVPLAVGALTLLAYSAVDGTLFWIHPVSIFALCLGLILAPRVPSEIGSIVDAENREPAFGIKA